MSRARHPVPLRTRPLQPPVVERQAAGPGQTAPLRFKVPRWPAPGPGPWPMVPPPDSVPPPSPAPAPIPYEGPYPLPEHVDERISEAALSWLDDLIAVNDESERRLEDGAATAHDAQVASTLRELAQEHHRFVEQLEPLVLGHEAESPYRRNGHQRLHRWWLALRRAFGRVDDDRVLQESERKERDVQEAYNAALVVLPRGRVRELVARQRSRVLAAQRRLTGLMLR